MESRWNDRELVLKTPILTAFLIEGGAVQQLWRIWTTHTADGQSLSGWACVTVAVCLWLNFYRVVTPDAIWAKRTTALGIVLNFGIVLSIIYWRFLR